MVHLALENKVLVSISGPSKNCSWLKESFTSVYFLQ